MSGLFNSDMYSPAISCVMPVYNCASVLPAALHSIIKQTFTDWELIAADDGSSDATASIAEEFAAADPRIKVFRCQHGGISQTLNFAVRQSRGEFIARMDGDDISHPRRFEKQIDFLRSNPHIMAAGSKVRIFPQIGMTAGMKRYERWLNKARRWEVLERDIFIESPLVHPSVMFRRSVFDTVGMYEEGRWPEDYQLWLRMWDRGLQMAKLDEVLFFWRDVPSRLTRVDERCSHDALRDLKVSRFLRAFFPEAGDPPSRHALPEHKRSLIIWGAGPNGKALVKELRRHDFKPAFFTDILEARRGQTICGLKVLGIHELPPPDNYFLVTAVGNPLSREEIRAFLNERGWQEGRDFLCMAGISD